jgi:hypothetical protein
VSPVWWVSCDVSQPSWLSWLVRVLHNLHVGLCELQPGLSFATMVNEASHCACVGLLHRKRIWCPAGLPRAARAPLESVHLLAATRVHDECCIQTEPTAGYSPEANGLAVHHNVTLLNLALLMLADWGERQLGLLPLGREHGGDAVLCSNHFHIATLGNGALVTCDMLHDTCRLPAS